LSYIVNERKKTSRNGDYMTKLKEKIKGFSEIEKVKLNNKYIDNKLIELKDYFDNMYKMVDENITLDLEQRIAILTDEDYNMIIAGAGSGKTTTITAKVKYLVDIKKINPNDIVIISFTNKAVEELKQRINNDFKIDSLITTFHKLGLMLLDNKNYKIIDNPYNIIKEYFDNELCNDKLLKVFNKQFKEYFKLPFFIIFFKNFNSYYNFIKKIKIFKIKPKDYYYKDFIYFCINIISKMKGKDYKFDDNDDFTNFINNLYNYYQVKLDENNYLDFEDIIIKATNCLDIKKLKYKYIIVDEYQDISYQRFKLLKKLSDVCNAKVIVVGDDFQSIYNFSGSDINLFTDFSKIFGYGSVLKITNTYRNSQQLISIAGNFVMKNKKQIKKQLISNKSLENPIEIILYNNFNYINRLNYCLKDIIDKYGINQKILILGRYKHDINKYLGDYFKLNDNKIKSIKYSDLDITYLTVHSSKGLGFDQVIILNCNNELYGFPSKIEDNKYIKLINSNNQVEEERRLFYVALTRTKNKVYILSNKSKQSEFIKEIKNYSIKLI